MTKLSRNTTRKLQQVSINSRRPDHLFPFYLIVIPVLRCGFKGKMGKPSTLNWKAEVEKGKKCRRKKNTSKNQWRWILFCSAMTNLQLLNQGQTCTLILQSGWEQVETHHPELSVETGFKIKERTRKIIRQLYFVREHFMIRQYTDTWRKSQNTLEILFLIIISFSNYYFFSIHF